MLRTSAARMHQLTASIVAYCNSPEVLGRAIRSIFDSHPQAFLYVVDNSPTDILRKCCVRESIQYIWSGKNLGFGAAHNVVIREVVESAKYHLILNPDVYFGGEVLPALLAFLNEHPQVGLIMPKVLYPDGSVQHLCKLLPSPFDLIARRFMPGPLKRVFAKRVATYEMRDRDYDAVQNVPCLSGCFMLIPTRVLKEIGGFDERFFLYMEDYDLSRRIHERFDTVYLPDVKIFHAYAMRSYKSAKVLWLHTNSAVRYFNKWGWLEPARRSINAAARQPYSLGDLQPKS